MRSDMSGRTHGERGRGVLIDFQREARPRLPGTLLARDPSLGRNRSVSWSGPASADGAQVEVPRPDRTAKLC